MKNIKLDSEEKEMLLNLDEFKSVLNPNKRKKYQMIARNTLRKSKSISIRLTEKDLLNLKSKAIRIGIPYQTLVTSLIHRYNTEDIKFKI